MSQNLQKAQLLAQDWATNPRWKGVTRPYSAQDVLKLRGSVDIEHTIARIGAEKLWRKINTQQFVGALGCLTGNQAVQAVTASRCRCQFVRSNVS
jgi:isocitrate lyase